MECLSALPRLNLPLCGGSMGVVVMRFVRAKPSSSPRERIPLVCFATSGGARMQEALFSLMQMACTAAIIEQTEITKYSLYRGFN
ncbi:MAG: hypothetical protein IPM78_13650 [Moraxellaceae bacterium]|nr:hypothetical protein [Moraxellaceae bacterium]